MADISKVQVLKEYVQEHYEEGLFVVEDLTDEVGTSVFHFNFRVEEELFPAGIIVDKTVYLIIRAQIIDSTQTLRDREGLLAAVNELNRSYKAFKVFLDNDGAVYADICLTDTPEQFDPGVVGGMLDVFVQFLTDNNATLRAFFEK